MVCVVYVDFLSLLLFADCNMDQHFQLDTSEKPGFFLRIILWTRYMTSGKSGSTTSYDYICRLPDFNPREVCLNMRHETNCHEGVPLKGLHSCAHCVFLQSVYFRQIEIFCPCLIFWKGHTQKFYIE